MDTPGVQQLDLLQYCRKEFKLDSYRRVGGAPVFFSGRDCISPMNTMMYALLAFLGINLGYLMDIACKGRKDTLGDLCRKNAWVFMWFSGVALFILVVLGLYGYLT